MPQQNIHLFQYDNYTWERTDNLNIYRKSEYFNSLLDLERFTTDFIRAKELFTRKIDLGYYKSFYSCNICKTDLMDLDILSNTILLVTYHTYQNSDLSILVELFPQCGSLIKNSHHICTRITACRKPHQTYIRNMGHLNDLVLKFLKDMNEQVIKKASAMLAESDEFGTIRTVYEKQAIKEVNKLIGNM